MSAKKSMAMVWILLFVLAAGAAVGGFWIQRRVHYALMYEDKVRETVRQMVRPEALRPAQGEEGRP